MITLNVKIKQRSAQAYPIMIGQGLLKNACVLLPLVQKYNRVVIITDSLGKRLFGNPLVKNLLSANVKSILLSFPSGEKSKTRKVLAVLEDLMLKAGCGKDTVILALGGGVVGDLAGFVAATYMRGIDYVQIPTTLLAMVDSSIGGKTGIDTTHGKNLIGAVWQPKAVIVDVDCLKSLPRVQIINGLVEAIKMFMTSDKKSFDYVKSNLPKILSKNPKVLIETIRRAVKIKAGIIGRDETEKHERMTLNFGHTIGHALEKLSNYRLMHGEAVALGVLAEAKISRDLRILSRADYDKIIAIMERVGITAKSLKKWYVNDVIAQTKSDKKTRNGKARYILLERIGKVHSKNGEYAHFVDDKAVKNALSLANH